MGAAFIYKALLMLKLLWWYWVLLTSESVQVITGFSFSLQVLLLLSLWLHHQITIFWLSLPVACVYVSLALIVSVSVSDIVSGCFNTQVW